MTAQTKVVKFYDVVLEKADEHGVITEKQIKADFWTNVFTRVEQAEDVKLRTFAINRTRYSGAVHRPSRPAVDHLQLGRVRDLSEHLETIDLASGDVEMLEFEDPEKRVSEPTFLVPLANGKRVAILSPGRVTRQETIASWLTTFLDLPTKGRAIKFRAVVDQEALTRIIDARGAVGVDFNVDAEDVLPTGDTELPLLDAIESVRQAGPTTGTLSVGWSLGRDGGMPGDRSMIQKLAYKIATGDFSRRASVNLILEDEVGKLHREVHNIFEDQIVEKVSFDVEADTQSSEEVILVAMTEAIRAFGARAGGTSGRSAD